MLTFAIVTSRGTGPLGIDLQARLDAVASGGTLDGQLAFPVAERCLWYNADRSIAAVAWWSGFDPFASGRPWHATDTSFTVFSGHVWPRGLGWDWTLPWAPQLKRFCERPAFPADVDLLSGTFTAAHIRSRGSGCVFADPFSIGNIYTAERPGSAVFASRAAIAAWLATRDGQTPRRDALAMGWMAHAGVILDDVTGFEGVRLLPQCSRIELEDAGDHAVRTALHPARWHARQLRPGDAAALARHDLETEVAAISEMPATPLLADLTGGKDSRMLLAAMLSAGVADRFRFSTAGAPDLPDVRIADELVEQLGLQRAGPTPVSSLEAMRWGIPEGQDQRRIDRRFVFGTSGTCTLWSAEPIGPPSCELKLNGVGGEPWYTNYPASGRLRRLDQVHAWLYAGQKIGCAGLVKADARAHYDAVVADMAEELCEGSSTPQDAVDRYYLRVRMRRWFGTLLEVDRRNRVLPLFSAPAIAAAFALDSSWRHAQYLPYALMSGADSRLVTTPFAGDVWPQALGALVDDPRLTPDLLASPTRPVAGTGSTSPTAGRSAGEPKQNVSTGTRVARVASRLDDFRSLVLDDPSHPLFEVVDRQALEQAVDGYDTLSHPQKLQVFGAITAGVWLGRHDEPLHRPSPGRV